MTGRVKWRIHKEAFADQLFQSLWVKPLLKEVVSLRIGQTIWTLEKCKIHKEVFADQLFQ